MVQRFHILERPLRGWFQEDLRDIVHTCVILHNMIVEARFGKLDVDVPAYIMPNSIGSSFPLFGRSEISGTEAANDGIDLFLARSSAFDMAMQSSYEHFLLKQDLVEHICSMNL